MKRTNLVITIVFVFVLVNVNVYAQSGTQSPGVISEINGTVELQTPGSENFIQANTGDTVSQETVISTGFRSAAMIQVGSAVITVRPMTRLSLTEIISSDESETLNLNLQAGRVRVDLNPPAGTKASMSVSSPMATASVRGTTFELDTRNVYVSKGAVTFAGNRGKPTIVNAGTSSHVESSGRSANPNEKRKSTLIPQPPVGTGITGGNTNELPTQSEANFTLTIKY